jgi:hypothetical protein
MFFPAFFPLLWATQAKWVKFSLTGVTPPWIINLPPKLWVKFRIMGSFKVREIISSGKGHSISRFRPMILSTGREKMMPPALLVIP